MKTSISPFAAALSRSSRIVDAGRAATASGIKSLRGAGLRLQIGALVDPRHAGKQVIHFGLCHWRHARTRLALRAGGDHAALLQDIFAHRQSRAGLLLVAD